MLSNSFLQILIGCAPFLLVFLALSIFSKKHRVRNIIVTVLIAAVAGSGALIDFGKQEITVSEVPQPDELRFAYSLIQEGSYDLAADVIKNGRATGAYSDDQTLALARISLLQGKTQAAKSLYAKLPESDERTAVLAVESNAESALQAVNKSIEQYLEDNESDAYDRAAKAAAFATTHYAEFLNGGAINSTMVDEECRKIIKLSKNDPELLRLSALRIARMKLQIMLEDYAGIADCVDDYADYNELLIVSELYMNGYIEPKDFSADYRKADMENYEVVADTLQDVYNTYYRSKSREERNAAKAQITALKALMENPTLVKVQNGLLEYAQSEFAYDRSKVYLQLAKTENFMGNIIKSNEYVDKSLNTVGDCTDEEFTAPMYEIIGIIADKDDPERLKDVAVYTDRILSNTMTIQMSDELQQPAADSNEEETNEQHGTGESENAADETEPEVLDFSTQFNTYVSQKRMAINITAVEAGADGVVRANININGDLNYTLEQIKDALEVSDCDVTVLDYTLEKVEYKASNILMCCDVSGSMTDQAIIDLKKALTDFVNTTEEIESVALVTFSSGIEDVCVFGTPNEELLDTINGIYAGGGTDIYGAVVESIGKFSRDIDAINTIILMSDGEDYMPDSSSFDNNIVQPCADLGITIYSVGLTSDVDSELLTYYAAGTGGSYVYASDSSQISAFFDSLRAQTLNSYRLTYTPQDKLLNTRNLRVTLNGESYTYDEEWYTLDGSPVDESAIGDGGVFFENKAIFGFDEKLIFKSERSRELFLRGSGFAEDDKFTIGLIGKIDYSSLAWEYVDSTTLKVTIPAGIACDIYDVRIGLNGRKTTLYDGLSVVMQGSEKQTVFGDYVFTSYFKEVTEDGVKLSQFVTMNGWLSFKGEVKLVGDLNGESITLITGEGACVRFDSDADGVAAAYAGGELKLPINGEFTLYSRADADPYSTWIDRFDLVDVCTMYDTRFIIHPDNVEFASDDLTLTMPYLDDVLSGTGLYRYYTEVRGSISAGNIDINAQYDNLSDRDRPYADTAASLGNTPIFINTSYTRFALDSDGVYLDYVAALPFISNESAFDLSIFGGFADGESYLDDVQLRSAYDVALDGVPAGVSMGDFKLSLKQNSDKYVLVGGFKMGSQTLGELFPGIEQYVGDMADAPVVSCCKSELILPLGEHYITAKADVTMYGHIYMPAVTMELGRSDYTNKLLGLDSDGAYGFSGLTNGTVGINNGTCDIGVNGDIKVHITDSFIGITGDGELSFDADWWTLTQALSGQGTAMIGIQQTHDGELAFVTRAQSGDKIFDIQWSGTRGDYYGSTQL